MRLYPVQRFDEDGTASCRRARCPAPSEALSSNGCLTRSADLDGLPALARGCSRSGSRTAGRRSGRCRCISASSPAISDEAFVTRYFRGLGYRSRGIGAEGLGRRIYIGPFTSQGALDQALALAREAGFIAPYVAKYTRF